MALEIGGIPSGAILEWARHFCLDADSARGASRSAAALAEKSRARRHCTVDELGILRADLCLSLVVRNALVRKPFLRVPHADFCTGAGGGVRLVRRPVERRSLGSPAIGSAPRTPGCLELRTDLSVVDTYGAHSGRGVLERGGLQPVPSCAGKGAARCRDEKPVARFLFKFKGSSERGSARGLALAASRLSPVGGSASCYTFPVA